MIVGALTIDVENVSWGGWRKQPLLSMARRGQIPWSLALK
jgi:hypothetical protein